MRALRRSMLMPVWAVLALSSGSVAGQDLLGAPNLKVLVTGNTVDSETLSNGQAFRSYFAPSGEIVVQRDDAMTFSGYWSVRADGTLCISFTNEACGKVAKNADGTYTRNVSGVPTIKWIRITPGKAF